MSFFGSSFSTSARPADGIFNPIIDLISDFGWGLLPQFPGSVRPGAGSGSPSVYREPEPVVIAPVPVAYEPPTWGIEAETTFVPEVLPGYEPARRVEVPREIVVVEGVSTEVERHPEGDFPAGSIFAPGQAWEDHGLDSPDPVEQEDVEVSIWSEIFDTVLGRQDWQIGPQVPAFDPFGPMYAAGGGVPMQRPTGRAALPPSAAPVTYTGGGGMNDCGNRRYVTLDRETGKISCKRRRRRRLLTNRDLADLASLKTITGGGAALNAAVIRAVR